jgi:hypothetical protein
LRDGPRGFPRGFTCPAVLGRELGRQGAFAYRAVTFFGRAFQLTSANPLLCNSPDRSGGPEPSHNTDNATLLSLTRCRFGLFPVRSPLLRESLLLSLPRGTEMVHFPPLASTTHEFGRGRCDFIAPGFPIRTSSDRVPACGYPRLIAACYVLHRLPAPRHPPHALSSLTMNFRMSSATASFETVFNSDQGLRAPPRRDCRREASLLLRLLRNLLLSMSWARLGAP